MSKLVIFEGYNGRKPRSSAGRTKRKSSRGSSAGQKAWRRKFGAAAKSCWKEFRAGRLTRKSVPKCIRDELR